MARFSDRAAQIIVLTYEKDIELKMKGGKASLA